MSVLVRVYARNENGKAYSQKMLVPDGFRYWTLEERKSYCMNKLQKRLKKGRAYPDSPYGEPYPIKIDSINVYGYRR